MGFKFNPHDHPCITNKNVKRKLNANDNDGRMQFLEFKCEEHRKSKATQGKVHKCLGMTLDHSQKRRTKVHVKNHAIDMINSFPMN